jgi:hypothetical protein
MNEGFDIMKEEVTNILKGAKPKKQQAPMK